MKNHASRAKVGLRKILVIDDETYVPVGPKRVKWPKFHATSSKKAEYSARFKPVAKFLKKLLIW